MADNSWQPLALSSAICHLLSASMRTVAIIPAYNEASRIAQAIADAKPHVSHVVVVDDCSHDATGEVAKTAGAVVLRHVINRGQGAALQTGTTYALDALDAEAIVHFDADGQMTGSEIPTLLEPLLRYEADIVLGSRFLGKEALDMPSFRRLMLRLATLFTVVFSGIRVTDTHNGFRALSRRAAEDLVITLDRMAHASEILDLIIAKQLRYVERPVTIRYSSASLAKGQSTLRAMGSVKDMLRKRMVG